MPSARRKENSCRGLRDVRGILRSRRIRPEQPRSLRGEAIRCSAPVAPKTGRLRMRLRVLVGLLELGLTHDWRVHALLTQAGDESQGGYVRTKPSAVRRGILFHGSAILRRRGPTRRRDCFREFRVVFGSRAITTFPQKLTKSSPNHFAALLRRRHHPRRWNMARAGYGLFGNMVGWLVLLRKVGPEPVCHEPPRPCRSVRVRRRFSHRFHEANGAWRHSFRLWIIVGGSGLTISILSTAVSRLESKYYTHVTRSSLYKFLSSSASPCTPDTSWDPDHDDKNRKVSRLKLTSLSLCRGLIPRRYPEAPFPV